MGSIGQFVKYWALNNVVSGGDEGVAKAVHVLLIRDRY